MVACASTRTQKSAGEQVDDSVTTGRVKAALIADPVTKAHQIDVETFKGTVQLNGFVDTAASKERASEVAKSTKGVTSVHNNLTVKTRSDRSGEQVVDDGAITTKVKAALAGDPRTKAHQVNVETREGDVQLSGFVDNFGSEVDGRRAGPRGRQRQERGQRARRQEISFYTKLTARGRSGDTPAPFCLAYRNRAPVPTARACASRKVTTSAGSRPSTQETP